MFSKYEIMSVFDAVSWDKGLVKDNNVKFYPIYRDGIELALASLFYDKEDYCTKNRA